ncbi:hypothetical protein M2102_001279 [Fusobacterium sp. PH5-7]|uniref:hypothetical protein n=1 Tax=Fusobacterium sp. PH5-7 TaxID=2940528 RepID=UPI0024731ED0|nr:hypothetical protein [Fusobacterium sp. PH5-7]MDH6457651.1 hypothetical protein [Fusobacterium sp. PH5-7]
MMSRGVPLPRAEVYGEAVPVLVPPPSPVFPGSPFCHHPRPLPPPVKPLYLARFSVMDLCVCLAVVREKASTCNFMLGKFSLAIVLVLLPPVCPLALLPLVESRNLPSIFSQVVPKYLVAGLLDKVVM